MKAFLISKHSKFLFLLFLLSSPMMAQNVDQWCATTDGKVEWLKKYQANPAAYEKTEDVLFVPLTIHVVGTNDGTGFFGLERILKAFCTLNQDFAPSNIRFFIEGDIRYIYSTAYATHNFNTGWQMMQQNNVSNTINCYIVEDPAGACGYAYYAAGIALKKTCIGPGDHTWAHEVGHYLSLPHTFYGWEGEVPEAGVPAPNNISGTQVEKVNGSNCTTAADGFCDTPPDYLSDRWTCNTDGLSSLLQTDPNGQTFRSDGSLFMSYADDACSNRFSDQQIQAMRTNLEDDRPNLLYNQNEVPNMPDVAVVLTSPAFAEVTGSPAAGITLTWEPIPNATHYIVQVNPFPAFSYVLFEFNTAEPTVTVQGLDEDQNYYWRVKPYSAYSSCIPFSANGKFRTGFMTTGTNDPSGEHFSLHVYPNPLTRESHLNLEFNLEESETLALEVFNGTGIKIATQIIEGVPGENKIKWTTAVLPAGIYYISLTGQSGRSIEKVVVQ